MRRGLVIVASIAIVLVLVRAAGFREVADTWRSVRPSGVLLSVACYLAAIGVRVAAWRRLLGPGAPSAARLAPPLSLGFGLGHVAPAKTGEPVAAVLVSRAFGLPFARTLSVLAAERALQAVALLGTFVPAAAIVAGRVLELRGAVAGAAILLAIAVAGVPFAGPVLRRLEGPARRLPRGGTAAGDFLASLAALLADRRRVVPLLGLATLFWMLQYVSLWAILDAGGADVNLVGAAAVAGSAILGGTLTLLPLGTQDGISAVVLAGLGVPLARGFALALFHTVLSLACGAATAVAAAAWGGRAPSRS